MLKFPDKKYNIIYADPPWYFKARSSKGYDRNPIQHYNCMDLDDIKNLPVKDITDKNCVLFMWAIDPMLPQAFEVITSWGFIYKTVAFTWAKTNSKSMGMFTGLGYWTRGNPEMCLLATKGKPKRVSAGVHQIIDSRIQEHSKKPDVAREKIVELMGDLPRIELFARQTAEGWDSWGNEV